MEIAHHSSCCGKVAVSHIYCEAALHIDSICSKKQHGSLDLDGDDALLLRYQHTVGLIDDLPVGYLLVAGRQRGIDFREVFCSFIGNQRAAKVICDAKEFFRGLLLFKV